MYILLLWQCSTHRYESQGVSQGDVWFIPLQRGRMRR